MSLIAAILIDGELGTRHIFPVTFKEWSLLITIGLLSFVVQFTLTKALQLELASTVALERKSSDVIFAFLFQIVIFWVSHDVICVIGDYEIIASNNL